MTIVDNLGLTEAQQGDATEMVAAIQRYVEGEINESVERRTFRRRFQQPGESFDDFLVSLRELVKTCKFCSNQCTQKNIRDQIIVGLIEGDTVEALLREKDLSLDTTITKCRAQEAVKKQRAEMADTSDANIHVIRHRNSTHLPASKYAHDVALAPTLVAVNNVLPTTLHAISVRRWATMLEYVGDNKHPMPLPVVNLSLA